MRWLAPLLLVGCPKPASVQAPPGTTVRLGSVVEHAQDDGSAPDEVAADAVADALARRGITVTPVPLDVPHRQRLQALADGADGLVVLLESRPRFSSQMNGRYRWTVEVDAHVARADALGDVEEATFTVPVHLLYAHEAGDQALAEAAPTIARRVGRLVDGWLVAPPSGARATPAPPPAPVVRAAPVPQPAPAGLSDALVGTWIGAPDPTGTAQQDPLYEGSIVAFEPGGAYRTRLRDSTAELTGRWAVREQRGDLVIVDIDYGEGRSNVYRVRVQGSGASRTGLWITEGESGDLPPRWVVPAP